MKKFAVTDHDGQVSIESFNSKDTIVFQHPSYLEIRKTKAEILASGPVIYLEKKFILLEESVVSATRWEQNKKEIPNRIEKIPASRSAFFNPQTAADMLGTSDQIFIQKSQMGGGSPMIRGFAANAILIVVDGIRMNNAIFRSGNLQNVILLDPNSIENAEVIFGPGTVIYGSDALGGVMDFHTLHPSLSTSDKPLIKSHDMLRYASANNEFSGHIDFTIGKKKTSWLTSFSWSDFGNLKMGSRKHPEYQRTEYVRTINYRDTIVPNDDPDIEISTGYQQVNFLQKIRFRPTKDLDFSAALHYSNSGNIPRYDRLIQYKGTQLKYAQWYYGPQQWIMPVLSAEDNRKRLLYDHMKISMAYQYYTESRHDRKFGKNNLRHRTEQVNIGTLTADFEKTIIPEKESLFYGFETTYNNINSSAETEDITNGITTPAATRYPDGYNHYYAVAAYTIFKQNLNDRFTLNLGGRYNLTGLHSMIGDTSFYHFPFTRIDIDNGALNGSVGLVYHPGSSWQINLNLSSGFRAPNLDDAGKVFDSEPGKVIVPNKDLKPEYLYNLDLGLIRKDDKRLSFEFSAFFSYLDNAMVRRPYQFNGRDSIVYDGMLSAVEALTNTGFAYVYGSNFSATLKLSGNFSINSSLTGTFGKDNEGFPLRHAAPLFGASHLVYENKWIRADLNLRYNGTVPNSRLAPSEQSKPYMYATDANGNPCSPGWTTLNLITRFILPWNLRVQVGIENISDIRYRPYSSGIVAPGRNFIFSLRYTLG
ncbi:MAG: TonB-dependent receptor [Chlorobi bacterium]|nr:TonB-dependent receptor [Chlorobiota bacterium]